MLTIDRPAAWVKVLVCALLIVSSLLTGNSSLAATTQADSLALLAPQNVRAWSVYSPGRDDFVVWLTWDDLAVSCAAMVHAPDTSGWTVGLTAANVSVPSVRGVYRGDIDRTLQLFASTPGFDSAMVGGAGVPGDTATIIMNMTVKRQEWITGTLQIGRGYTPGTWVKIDLINVRDQGNPTPVDLGLWVKFDAGWVGNGRSFVVGMEDFEGYHIWRGIEEDGSDMEIIGEISKEEAYFGRRTGGSIADSVYYYWLVPQLRFSGVWFSPFGTLDCLGTSVRLDLGPQQLFWFDCQARNGFTYQYAISTFDRGYSVSAGRQGLVKFDNCQPDTILTSTGRVVEVWKCTNPDERSPLVPLKIEVEPNDDMQRVYAVPNPYRTGGSRLTRAQYHNFPDDKIRFVYVPERATIRIYTVAGDLVWEYDHPGPNGVIEWNVTNRNGEDVASGVYIYKVESSSGDTVFGRVVVIR